MDPYAFRDDLKSTTLITRVFCHQNAFRQENSISHNFIVHLRETALLKTNKQTNQVKSFSFMLLHTLTFDCMMYIFKAF